MRRRSPVLRKPRRPAVRRLDAAALLSLETQVRQPGTPTLIEGLLKDAWTRWRTAEHFARRHGGVRVTVRDNIAVARSGGMFHAAEAGLSLREHCSRCASADGHPLLFSTARDECYASLRRDYPPPPLLAGVEASPIVSIGGPGGGLAFHQHDESWLALVTGSKEWRLFPPGGPPPPHAHERVAAGDIDAQADGMLAVTQHASEVLYLPAGWWHATWNTEGLTVGVGGMGFIGGGELERLVRAGSVAQLAAALGAGAEPEPEARPLSAVAAEVGRLEMLRWLSGRCEQSLQQRDQAQASVLHWAAAGGTDAHAECVAWLLATDEGLGLVGAPDQHGAVPMHWAARGGHPAVARALADAGADVGAVDATGTQPLHLFCAEGHLEVARWLVRRGARPDAADSRGQRAVDWAAGCGRQHVVDWLRSEST